MSVSLIVTVGLAIVILAVAAGLMARNRSIRALVTGIGLAAIPAGLYLTGLTDLTINGLSSLIAWVQRTPFTRMSAWGVGLIVGGIVVAGIGTLLPKGRRAIDAGEKAPENSIGGRQESPRTAIPGTRPTPGQRPAPVAEQRATPQKSEKAQKGLDPEDAEIEALLRKRGIM